MRWAIQLSAFEYDILYVKGESIPHADALSRLEFMDDQGEPEEVTSFVHWTETDVISLAELRHDTQVDPLMMSVIKRVLTNRWTKVLFHHLHYRPS